jgi:hypothetical protein
MSLSLSSSSLVESFIPSAFLIERFEAPKKQEEAELSAIARLIIQASQNAIKAFGEKNYKAFDANAGDSACQCRGLELLRQTSCDLSEQMTALSENLKTLRHDFAVRSGSIHEKGRCTIQEFFKSKLASLTISSDIKFLIQAYLLTFTKVPDKHLPSGVIVTKTDEGRLLSLSHHLRLLKSCDLKQITDYVKAQLSEASVRATYQTAMSLSQIESVQKSHLVRCLSDEATIKLQSEKSIYPKTLGCLFYEVKTLLLYCREHKLSIVLKTVSPETEERHLLLSPDDYKPAASSKGLSHLPIIVIEGVFIQPRDQMIKAFNEHNFLEAFLCYSAKQPPYAQNSSIADIPLKSAQEELLDYSDRPQIFEELMDVDHVYLSTTVIEGLTN